MRENGQPDFDVKFFRFLNVGKQKHPNPPKHCQLEAALEPQFLNLGGRLHAPGADTPIHSWFRVHTHPRTCPHVCVCTRPCRQAQTCALLLASPFPLEPPLPSGLFSARAAAGVSTLLRLAARCTREETRPGPHLPAASTVTASMELEGVRVSMPSSRGYS